MLTKLMKYEFKATARTFLPVYSVLLALAAANRITDSFNRIDQLPGLRVPLVALLFVAFFAIIVATLVISISRFWTNLLGREGYLMHTLPVSPAKQVASKLIVSVVWYIATTLVVILAMAILLSYSSLWVNIDFSFFSRFFRALSENGITLQSVLFVVLMLLISLAAAAYQVLELYFAMSVGQTSNNHRVWASIGVYVGVNILLNNIVFRFLGELFKRNISFGTTVAEQMGAANLILLGILLLCCAVSALFFYLTQMMLKRKLNLK